MRLLLSLPQSMLDDLELEPTYNPLQVWSHLYSHLNSTFAKPQGPLHPRWESRALRKVLPSLPFMLRIPESPLPLCPTPPHPREYPPWIPSGRKRAYRGGRKRAAFCPKQRKLQPLPGKGAFFFFFPLGHLHMFRYLNCSVCDKSLVI